MKKARLILSFLLIFSLLLIPETRQSFAEENSQLTYEDLSVGTKYSVQEIAVCAGNDAKKGFIQDGVPGESEDTIISRYNSEKNTIEVFVSTKLTNLTVAAYAYGIDGSEDLWHELKYLVFVQYLGYMTHMTLQCESQAGFDLYICSNLSDCDKETEMNSFSGKHGWMYFSENNLISYAIHCDSPLEQPYVVTDILTKDTDLTRYGVDS